MSETLASKEQRTRALWVLVKRQLLGTKNPTESPRVAEREVAGQWIKEAIVRGKGQKKKKKNRLCYQKRKRGSMRRVLVLNYVYEKKKEHEPN